MRALMLVWMAVGAALAQAPAPRAAPVPSYTELKFPPLKPIQIPNVARYTLANGLRVYLLEDHELPLVRGVALVRTGNLFDPPAKIGLADLTGVVMRSGGTAAKTGDQLDQELEDIAASVETGIGESSGSVSFSCLKENTDEVLGVFHDVLTDPQFRPDKLDLAKHQFRSGISRRNDDPEGILQREFRDTLYGRDTPYGWRMEYATIDAIQRGDLLDFYRRYFFPANIMLAVYGDFSTADMQARLEKLFAGWTVQQPAAPAFPKVRETAAPGIFLATKSDLTQTFFALGQLGDQLNDPDEPALDVMADILGGGFQSRLVQKVRTQLGYAYNISADWAADYDHPGIFEITGSTKSSSTTETIAAIQQEVARIRSGLVTEEELRTAKDTALNSLVFAFDSKSKTLNRLLTYEYYGYPKDFIQRYQKALAAVTRADVERVAQKHLKPEAFTVVAVGNPPSFGKPLATLGLPVRSIDLTIPEPNAPVKPSATAAPALPSGPDRAKALLQRAQEAVGGADRLAGIRDLQQVAEFLINSPDAPKVVETDRWVTPTHFRQDSRMPKGNVSAYSDGRGGWIVTPEGSGPMGDAQLKQVRGDLFRLYFRLLLSDRIPGRTLRAIGSDTVEIQDPQGNTARLVIDLKTFLPAKVVYDEVSIYGISHEVDEIYEQLAEVDGIKVPKRITVYQGFRKFADVTLTDYKMNSGLTAEELSKKP